MTTTMRIEVPDHVRVRVHSQDRVAVFGGAQSSEWVSKSDPTVLAGGEVAVFYVWGDRRIIVEEMDR